MVTKAQKRLLVRRLAEKDAHLGQAFSLWALKAHEGISQRDLAERLGVAPPTVNIMLKKMEKAGLIERRADAQDQRYTRIYLTELGRARHSELEAIHAEVVRATVGDMSDEEQRELERLLGVVARNLAAADMQPTTDDEEAES